MRLSAKQYAETLYALTKGKGEKEVDAVIKNFVSALSRRNNLCLAKEIIDRFERIYNEKHGIKKIEVTAARALDAHIKKEFEKLGEVATKTDESLVGGVKIKVGDTLVNASVKQTLKNLRTKIANR